MPKKLYENGPMGGTDPSLTTGSGMGTGDSLPSGGDSRPMNPAPKVVAPRKKHRKGKR